jgi:transposase
LRLKAAGLSDRRIAAAIGSARSTVQECLRRCRDAGLVWPLAEELDEAVLQARLYRREVPLSQRPLPDFSTVQAELRRPGVTRWLLWQEYKAAHPEGWQYSVFCEQYRRWLLTQDPVLRQSHAPGEKLLVDYAGQTVPVTDRYTGESRAAQIFVAVLGCSNYTYAEAAFSQQLPDWLGSQVRALEYFGGVPAAIVPDNLKSAVHRAHRYEPALNPSYQDFAEHYAVAILPARVRKPRSAGTPKKRCEVPLVPRSAHQVTFAISHRLSSSPYVSPFTGCIV